MTKNLKKIEDNNIQLEKEKPSEKPEEFGGTKGLEPTRYGDWQHKGRVSDF